MDYSLLVGIHDTEHVDSSEPEDEQETEEGRHDVDGGDGTTGDEESGDGLDESTDGGVSTGAAEGRRQRYSRTESVSSSDGYDSEYFALQCSDGMFFNANFARNEIKSLASVQKVVFSCNLFVQIYLVSYKNRSFRFRPKN